MISQAEALLAVLGMRPIVSHEIEQITTAQWKRAIGLEREIDEAARALVHGAPKPVADYGDIDYMATLDGLTTPYQPHQVEAMLSHLPAWFSDSSGEFIALARRAFSYMASQLPRQAKVSLAGASNLKPPQRLVDGFVSLFEVLDEPLRLLQLAAHAQLLGAQIKAVEAIYPTLTAYMRKAVATQIQEGAAKSKGFRLPYHAEMGAEKLLGADLTSPVMAKILRTPAQMASNKDNAGAGKPPSPGAAIPQQQETRVERTDNLGAG